MNQTLNSALLYVRFRPHKEHSDEAQSTMDFYQDAAGILMAEPEKHQAFKKLIFLTDPNIVLGTEFDMFFKVRYSTNELLAQFLLQAMRPLKFIENTETKVILPVEGSS